MPGAAAHRPDAAEPPGAGTVAVVGGGIAGLSAAWAIVAAAPDRRVVVLESEDELGGKIRTGSIGGRAVELGPDAFLARRPEAVALCRELGLGDELVSPGSRTAYVWARRDLRRLPAGLALGIPTRLVPLARSGILSPLGLGRAAVDLLARRPRAGAVGTVGALARDRPVAEITRRHLGREVTARLVDPLIGGIHAGDTTTMSTAAVFPALLDAAAQRGSLMRALRPTAPSPAPAPSGHTAGGEEPLFHTVRGGLARLVHALAAALEAKGVEVRRRAEVDRLTPGGLDGPGWALRTPQGTLHADAVILAVPAPAAAALLEPVDSALAVMVGAIDYADVTLVTMQMPATGVGRALDGTGFLVPAESGCLITACTWLTSKWPELGRPGDVILRASAGRFGDERAAGMSDDEVVRGVLDDLRPMLDLRAAPAEVIVTRWARAFPQYAVGHLDRVAGIERSLVRWPGLAVAGAAYRGVGIPACIASGRHAASAVLGRCGASGTADP